MFKDAATPLIRNGVVVGCVVYVCVCGCGCGCGCVCVGVGHTVWVFVLCAVSVSHSGCSWSRCWSNACRFETRSMVA